MQQNTALIDDIMAALDAESSQNVELIVRNTQNGATKKMALASLEQIIYSYLTTAPVVTNLASVLGGRGAYKELSAGQDLNDFISDVGGKYISLGGSTTTTLLNRPAGLIEAFAMWVIPPSTQIIITQWSALKMYKRTKDGANINKWQLVQGTEVNYA